MLQTILIAMLPVFELRGAIPYAMLILNETALRAFWCAVLGNLLPVIPLLILFSKAETWLESAKDKPKTFLSNFLALLFQHAKKRTNGMERLEALGLAIFVAVPLPGTGAWTGCILAALFKLRFWHSFLAISAGVLGAGIIVAWLTILGKLAVSGLLI